MEASYHRLPADGLEYCFRVRYGERDSWLRLRFHRTSKEGEVFRGFWFSRILGVTTRAEADRILLAAKKALESKNDVRLLTFEELLGLQERNHVALVDGHCEWLKAGDDASSKKNALFGEMTGGRLRGKAASWDHQNQRAGYRLVIEYDASDTILCPSEARAEPSKEPNEARGG